MKLCSLLQESIPQGLNFRAFKINIARVGESKRKCICIPLVDGSLIKIPSNAQRLIYERATNTAEAISQSHFLRMQAASNKWC
jgi:hypothetical protein